MNESDVAYWKGRKATDLTRDELLEAYDWATRALARERKFIVDCADVEIEFARTARVLRKTAVNDAR